MRNLGNVCVVDKTSAGVRTAELSHPLDSVLDREIADFNLVKDVFDHKDHRSLGGEPVVEGKTSGDGEELKTAAPGGDA